MLNTLSFPQRPTVDAIIQCAMTDEAAPILAQLTPIPGETTVASLVTGTQDKGKQSFNLGQYGGRTVLVVTSGIGLANAASATAKALNLVDSPIVIAAGTTGGLAREINVGDIAGGIATIYGAADATAFGYELGQVPQMPVDYRTSDETVEKLELLRDKIPYTLRVGRVVSSDQFMVARLADPMRERFPDAMGADMETCAMAQVAWSQGVDWVSLRAVSDLCGPAADQEFHMDFNKAAAHSARAVEAFMSVL